MDDRCSSFNDATEDRFLIYNNQELTFFDKDCRIPLSLGKTYGSKTRRLDLSFNSLTSLDGIESFTILEELILDNNYLSDNVQFYYNPLIHTLSLNKNKFTDLDNLLNLLNKNFPQLKYLSLLGNIACPNQLSSDERDDDDYDRYRRYVLHKLPNLKFLDSSKVKINERKDAIVRGAYMRIVRPNYETLNNGDNGDSQWNFSPLPDTFCEGTHSGAYGRLKHRYTGKHSEGNRFIRNHDL